MEVQPVRRRIGLVFFWGGVGLMASYFSLSVLGRWGLTLDEVYGWVRNFFTGPRVPIPVRIAIPAILAGIILLFLPVKGAVKKRRRE